MTLGERAADGERHIITFADGWKGEMRLSESGDLLIKGYEEEAPTRYDRKKVDKLFMKKHGALTEDHVAVVRKKKPEPVIDEDSFEEEMLIEEDLEDEDLPVINEIQRNATINRSERMPSKEENTMLPTNPMNNISNAKTAQNPGSAMRYQGNASAPNQYGGNAGAPNQYVANIGAPNQYSGNNNMANQYSGAVEQAKINGADPITLSMPQTSMPVRKVVASPYSQSNSLTVIQETIAIEGNINAKSDVRINGRIKGNVASTQDITITGGVIGAVHGGSITIASAQDTSARVDGNVTSDTELNIGNGSVVCGDITAKEALIQGAVKGCINVTERVILDSTAIVLGDIKAATVVMNEGMKYSGKVIQTGGGDTPETFFKGIEKDAPRKDTPKTKEINEI